MNVDEFLEISAQEGKQGQYQRRESGSVKNA
jgi:hypothetical protein